MLSRSEALRALTAPGEAYELMDVEQYGHGCRAFRNAPPLLRDLFESTASDLPFIVFGDERLTFAEAWNESCRIGALLVEEYGVRKGDRVAISMRNYPEWMTAFAAVTSIGAIAVAMNALWTPEEMEYGLKDSGYVQIMKPVCNRLYVQVGRIKLRVSCLFAHSVST